MLGSYRSQRKRNRPLSEINIVPYVDVTLVLLIIFMVTAPIVQQAVLVDLPQAPEVKEEKSSVAPPVPFVITVTKDGQYVTSEDEQRVLTQNELAELVAEVVARTQLNEQLPVYLQGDKDAPYGRVVHLFVVLKNNGVPNLSLMTTPED